ncbi:hypothetical protein ACOMHN_019504 [Nucella lapillus]
MYCGVDLDSEHQSFPADCDVQCWMYCGVDLDSEYQSFPADCDSAVLDHASGDAPQRFRPALNYGWSSL